MRATSRKRLFFWIRLALTIGVLAALVEHVGWDPMIQVAADATARWVVLTYGAAFCAMLMGAILLRYLLKRLGLDVGLKRILLANSLSTLYTLIVPGDLLAGAAKWADLSAATGDKPRVLSSMVFAKVALALAPLVIGSVVLAVENPLRSHALVTAAFLTSSVLVAGTVLFLNRRTGRCIDKAIEALLCYLPTFAQSRARSVARAFAEFRSLDTIDTGRTLVYSTAAFICGVAAMACAAKAVGVGVPVTVFAWVSMILFITRLVPVTISNLGIREGVLIAVFGIYGVEPAAAFATGMVMFSSNVLIAIVGAGYQVAIASGRVRWRIS